MPAEFYDRIRSQIQHEADLINHRLSWLLAAQSFLFAAYATILVWAPKPARPEFERPIRAMADWLPGLGIASCALLWFAIIAAIINTEC
jgi:hypothetical protein